VVLLNFLDHINSRSSPGGPQTALGSGLCRQRVALVPLGLWGEGSLKWCHLGKLLHGGFIKLSTPGLGSHQDFSS
jgi:hypothetical protein